MKKESNVADGERGDPADFLVTEVALELQVDDLALIFGQGFDDLQNLADCPALVEIGRDCNFRVP